MLSVDPLRKDNIRMLNEFEAGDVKLRTGHVRQPAQRAMYLAEIARLRMVGRSEEALNHLERTMTMMDDAPWVQGRLVQALLNFDDGRSLTAINTVKELAKDHPRHPHVRAVLHQLALLGKATRPPSEPTNIHWIIERETDWKHAWPQHNVTVAPVLDTQELKQHALKANAWSLLLGEQGVSKPAGKGAYKQLPDEVPLGLYTHLGGLTITISGMPVDLGLPSNIDIGAARKLGLLNP
jgi:hypothetical protein